MCTFSKTRKRVRHICALFRLSLIFINKNRDLVTHRNTESIPDVTIIPCCPRDKFLEFIILSHALGFGYFGFCDLYDLRIFVPRSLNCDIRRIKQGLVYLTFARVTNMKDLEQKTAVNKVYITYKKTKNMFTWTWTHSIIQK